MTRLMLMDVGGRRVAQPSVIGKPTAGTAQHQDDTLKLLVSAMVRVRRPISYRAL